VALMIANQTSPRVFDSIRMRIVDAFAPVLAIMASPVDTAVQAMNSLRNMGNVYSQNRVLQDEVRRLKEWQGLAARLEAENRSLRTLLNVPADPLYHQTTARIVASPGGGFQKSLVAMAGLEDGVDRNHLAVTDQGLVGRVIESGRRSSRILLLTDIVSRVPVLVGENRHPAVLGGTNGLRPRLFHLHPDTVIREGDRIVTSGEGGLFPRDIPVGVVAATTSQEVGLLADPARLDFVRILKTAMPAGTP
nr:rod shape-determining protein MreC [Pseudomonadota bacterium]